MPSGHRFFWKGGSSHLSARALVAFLLDVRKLERITYRKYAKAAQRRTVIAMDNCMLNDLPIEISRIVGSRRTIWERSIFYIDLIKREKRASNLKRLPECR